MKIILELFPSVIHFLLNIESKRKINMSLFLFRESPIFWIFIKQKVYNKS